MTQAPKIRIVRRPAGIWREGIRDQWIGIEIPLATEDQIAEDPPVGYMGSRGCAGEEGYYVLRVEAVKALRMADKMEAAEFWGSLPFGKWLRFKQQDCEVVQ